MTRGAVSTLSSGGVVRVGTTRIASPLESREWVGVCPLSWIAPGTGVAALLGREQVAIFRLHDDRVFAIGNRDPACGANVLARGIVGDHGAVPVVVSPMYKDAYDLATGVCASDDSLRVPVYAVRVIGGIVRVGPRRERLVCDEDDLMSSAGSHGG